MSSCECDAGYNDDDPVSGVHCVRAPARLSGAANATCNVRGFQFGMKHQIDAHMSTERSAQLGAMVEFLGGIDTNKIVAADFNDLCLVMCRPRSPCVCVLKCPHVRWGRGGACARVCL